MSHTITLELQARKTAWKHHTRLYEYGLLTLVIAASLLRIALISNNWPVLTSDEAMSGLMAKHIAAQGAHPIFYYGQYYTGALEAYIGAIFFDVFGPSAFALRAGLIFFFAFFLLIMFYLTRLLYNKQLALITIGLLGMGSSNLFLHQLQAVGNVAEIACLGALLFLIGSWLAITAQGSLLDKTPSTQRKRLLLYSLFGFLAGLAFWSNQIMLPWIVTTIVLLFLFCRHELRRWYGLYLALGAILGAAPLIYYNLHVPPDQSSPDALLSLYHAARITMISQHISPLRQLVGTLFYALPGVTGANPLCSVDTLPLFGPTNIQTFTCTIKQGMWTAGYCVLWGYACYLAVRALGRHRQHLPAGAPVHEERLYITLQWTRLLLLVSAMLTLVIYELSPTSALTPDTTSGDLICVLIALPALFWPLCNGVVQYKTRTIHLVRLIRITTVALLLFVEITFVFGAVQTLQDIPHAQMAYKSDIALIRDLLAIDATRIYTDYNTCGKLMLQSDEHIICSNLDAYLQPALDRYQPYQTMVRDAPGGTYVYRSDAPQITTIEREIRILNIPYQHYVFEGYVIYRTPVPLQ